MRLSDPTPGLLRRLACLLYESLLLFALLVVASFPVMPLVQALPAPGSRLVFQIYLLAVMGVYFVWCWRHGGQTLAMKTWRVQLVTVSGERLGLGRAWLRYGLAGLGLAGLGLGFFWALWDRDRQFLHDRLLGTRLMSSVALDSPERDDRTQAEQHQGG